MRGLFHILQYVKGRDIIWDVETGGENERKRVLEGLQKAQ